MLYGHKVIRLLNLGHRLYSCESLTQHFDWMGEARHIFTGPPHTRGYGGGYSGYNEGGSYHPFHGYLSLASEPEPVPLPGTTRASDE
jgi:hypothetical protein